MLTASVPMASLGSGVLKSTLKAELLCMYLGLSIAAIGDLHKSLIKARRGDDALVVGAARLAEFGHDTEHGNLSVGRHAGERLDGARNRQRIGVIGVVDYPGTGRRCFHRHPHR